MAQLFSLGDFAMNTIPRLLICISVSLTLVGCASYQNTMSSFGHGIGLIDTGDVQSADAYKKVLPNHLGLLPKQVDVQPASGVVLVTIYGVADESERQIIAAKLATLNTKNPQLSPMKWSFSK